MDTKKEDFWLLFDHGGVLDGCVIIDQNEINKVEDLVLFEEDWGTGVLKKGKLIITLLNELSNLGCRIAYASANANKDQSRLHGYIVTACKNNGLSIPKIEAAFSATSKESTHTTENPSEGELGSYPIPFYNISVKYEGTGKAGIRATFEHKFTIKNRERCYIFDDGDTVITEAKKETYSTYLVGSSDDILKGLQEIKKVLAPALPPRKGNLVENPCALFPPQPEAQKIPETPKAQVTLQTPIPLQPEQVAEIQELAYLDQIEEITKARSGNVFLKFKDENKAKEFVENFEILSIYDPNFKNKLLPQPDGDRCQGVWVVRLSTKSDNGQPSAYDKLRQKLGFLPDVSEIKPEQSVYNSSTLFKSELNSVQSNEKTTCSIM